MLINKHCVTKRKETSSHTIRGRKELFNQLILRLGEIF